MATNKFGVLLDDYGYAPSILPGHSETCCWRCGRNGSCDKLDRHEAIGGAYRKKSKELGLWVYLCHCRCHEELPGAVHKNGDEMRRLRRFAQIEAMRHYGWSETEFRQRFGKSYLE